MELDWLGLKSYFMSAGRRESREVIGELHQYCSCGLPSVPVREWNISHAYRAITCDKSVLISP